MATHSSATTRPKTLHINAAVKQRARLLIYSKSIDVATRWILG